MLPSWCIKSPKVELDMMHLKEGRTDVSVYKQLFVEVRDRHRDYIPVYTNGSWDVNYMACIRGFRSDTLIS